MKSINIKLNKDTIFYDGDCPLCRKEIAKLQQLTGDKVHFLDINSVNDEYLANDNAPAKDKLYQELHVRTKDGEWLNGVTANIRAWQHTPYANIVSLLGHPIIYPFSILGYQLWLRYYHWQRKKRIGKDCENSCDRR